MLLPMCFCQCASLADFLACAAAVSVVDFWCISCIHAAIRSSRAGSGVPARALAAMTKAAAKAPAAKADAAAAKAAAAKAATAAIAKAGAAAGAAAAAAAASAAASAASADEETAVDFAGKDVLEPSIPASKRPRIGDIQDCPSTKPILPPCPDPLSDDRVVDHPARDIMRSVVPWVLAQLPVALHESGLLSESENLLSAEPLDIKKADDGDLSSYKEAWRPANCHVSCQRTGYYEAGGSGLWIDPEVAADGELPFVDPGWHLVHEVGRCQFCGIEHNGIERVRFPVTMSCWWRAGVLALPKDRYPSGIVPLGGKVFIWAWYVEMFKALDKNDHKRIKLLYECILTVTIIMFTSSDKAIIVEESIKMSETVRATVQATSDSFVTFASKILLIDPTLNAKQLAARDIRHQGGLINVTMVQTIKHIQNTFLHSPECMARLQKLDRIHGQDVLTASYNKIKLFLSTVKNDASTSQWVLDQMLTALDRKEVSKGDFLLDAYKKPRNGAANFVQMAMATKLMTEHCISIIDGLSAVDAELSQKLRDNVTSNLCNPALYNTNFPVDAGEAEDVEPGSDDEGSGVQESKDDFLDKVTSTCPRVGTVLAELMRKIYDGDYNEAVTAIALSDQPLQLLHAMDEQTLGAYAKDMAELLKSLHANDSVVGLSSTVAAPKASLRELVRATSDGGDKEQAAAERQDVWKRAVANRKKLVTLVQVKSPRQRASYLEALNKFSAFSSFRGEVAKSHRVFVISCDLLNQKGKQPWTNSSSPDEKTFEEMLAFLTHHGRADCDVIMAWDGCLRKSRRTLEDSIGQLPSSAEVFIVYGNSWNGWIKKKYHLGSENTECGYISYARQRTHTALKERGTDFCAAGESNSHFTSFTGVSLPGRSTLARISVTDKEKIFSETTDPLPKKWLDNVPVGVPMFWSETKSMTTWYQLLDELQAGCVVDVSPGSGVLASACMQRGTPYLGLLGNAQHLTWLTNVIDRNACKFMCTTGNFLYQEDLATLLNELFADVVDPKDDATAEEAIQQDDEE